MVAVEGMEEEEGMVVGATAEVDMEEVEVTGEGTEEVATEVVVDMEEEVEVGIPVPGTNWQTASAGQWVDQGLGVGSG